MSEPKLPWSVMVVVLAGVGSAAWLSLIENWTPWQAYGGVVLVTGGLCLGLVIVLCAMTPRREWPELMVLARKTFDEDWRAVRNLVRQTFGGN